MIPCKRYKTNWRNMKYLKITLFILLIALISNLIITEAKVRSIVVSYKLEKNTPVITSKFNKTSYSVQEYENTHTSTSLHNPCKNCVISVRVYNSSTDYSTAVLTKMGHTYEVGRTTHAVPGNHKLKIARSDKTYLNTEHSALWYID